MLCVGLLYIKMRGPLGAEQVKSSNVAEQTYNWVTDLSLDRHGVSHAFKVVLWDSGVDPKRCLCTVVRELELMIVTNRRWTKGAMKSFKSHCSTFRLILDFLGMIYQNKHMGIHWFLSEALKLWFDFQKSRKSTFWEQLQNFNRLLLFAIFYKGNQYRKDHTVLWRRLCASQKSNMFFVSRCIWEKVEKNLSDHSYLLYLNY